MIPVPNGHSGRGWTWQQTLSGVVPPVISPLDHAGAPDTPAMAALVEYVLQGGCSGLFVLGGCGAGPWLTTDDRQQILQAAVRAARGRCAVLAGVMLPATRPAVEAAKRAVDDGADAVVVSSPYYFDVDAAAQRRHVEAILNAVPVPLLLYNIPQCTHHRLAPETVALLAAERRILGVKDSAGEFPAFLGYVAIKGNRADFMVLQGNEPLMAPSLQHGGDGLIPGLANVAPALFVALRQAAAAEDSRLCQRLQEEIVTLKRIEQGGWLAALTAGCAALGFGSGVPPAPFAPATAEHRAAIGTVLRDIGALAVGQPAAQRAALAV